jgi:D-beta-D-heptose 7-phosphate kinase/D-beta-D-heptose 1-phosphate adenosyltransferase
MTLLLSCGKTLHLPTRARAVFDVSGAGDTVVAAMAAALAAGASLQEGASLASLAAGVVVGKVGTATASPEEIRESAAISELTRTGG